MIDGDDYQGVLQAYQNKFQSEEAKENSALQWRLAVTQKMLALKNTQRALPKDSLNQTKTADSLLLSEKNIFKNKQDSLAFALEKAKVQLSRLKRLIASKENGEYLTFTTPKGTHLHYVGQVEKGKANGYGVAILATGSRYQGYWADNLKEGEGSFYWADGEYYVGQYQNDLRNGVGTYYWPNGEKYVGEWKDDKRYGEGAFYAKDGTLLAKGTWKNDKLISAVKRRLKQFHKKENNLRILVNF